MGGAVCRHQSVSHGCCEISPTTHLVGDILCNKGLYRASLSNQVSAVPCRLRSRPVHLHWYGGHVVQFLNSKSSVRFVWGNVDGRWWCILRNGSSCWHYLTNVMVPESYTATSHSMGSLCRNNPSKEQHPCFTLHYPASYPSTYGTSDTRNKWAESQHVPYSESSL